MTATAYKVVVVVVVVIVAVKTRYPMTSTLDHFASSGQELIEPALVFFEVDRWRGTRRTITGSSPVATQ